MNMTAGEFSNLDERQRAIVTFELLCNVQERGAALADDMKVVKADIVTIKECNLSNINKTEKAQDTADAAIKIGDRANKRIDGIIWAVAGFAITTLVSLGFTVINYVLQRGAK